MISPVPALPPNLILGGTGHRPHRLVGPGGKNGYHATTDALLCAFALDVVRYYAPRLIISGMALAWDTAVAEAAVELGIPFHAYVPFPGQEGRWPKPARDRYVRLLSQAEEVRIVYRGRISDATVRKAMWARDQAMVADADAMLALYDGTASGGTYNTLAYAAVRGRTAVNVWDRWRARVAKANAEMLREAA